MDRMKSWLGVVVLILYGARYGCSSLLEFQADLDEIDCPRKEDKWMPTKQVPWNSPGRALLTLPPGVALRPSSIPGAGMGVVATTFLPRYTWLAEYEGEVVVDEDDISDYAWMVTRHGEESHYVDGLDPDASSWLRWINCPRHAREENVASLQCLGRVHYLTARDVRPGEELLAFYGADYATTQLNIDMDAYANMALDVRLYDEYACWGVGGKRYDNSRAWTATLQP